MTVQYARKINVDIKLINSMGEKTKKKQEEGLASRFHDGVPVRVDEASHHVIPVTSLLESALSSRKIHSTHLSLPSNLITTS